MFLLLLDKVSYCFRSIFVLLLQRFVIHSGLRVTGYLIIYFGLLDIPSPGLLYLWKQR